MLKSAAKGRRAVHFQKLDGLRAYAVIGVLLQHYSGFYPLGTFGVKLFFVISGFLITGILLDIKAQVGDRSIVRPLGAFYARRGLRILPAYYLLLLIGFIFNLQDFQTFAPWHFLHGSNILAVLTGRLENPWWTSHFWSLAVEEQFYLVWPLLILICPRLLIAPLVVLVIIGGHLFSDRAYLLFPDYPIAADYFTFAAFDELGAGALLAIYRRHYASLPSPLMIAFIVVGAIGIALLIPYNYNALPAILSPYLYYAPPATTLLFVGLVDYAASNKGDWPSRFLSAKPLVQLGKISYGVYLFHLPVYMIVDYGCRVNGLACSQLGIQNFLLSSALTIIISLISWRMLEKPLNDLKIHFPYFRAAPHKDNLRSAKASPSPYPSNEMAS